jgi:exosortase E/protease (VPEID-CTERM system)
MLIRVLPAQTRGWLGIALVLVCEYLAVTVTVDAYVLTTWGGTWEWFPRLGALAPLGIVIVAVWESFRTVLSDGVTDRRAKIDMDCSSDSVAEQTKPCRTAPAVRWGPRLLWCGVHACAYVLLLMLTRHIFCRQAAPPGMPLAWLVLWLLSCLSVVITLVGTFAPRFVSPSRSLIRVSLGSVGIAVLAWIAGRYAATLWPLLADLTLRALAVLMSATFSNVVVRPDLRYVSLENFGVTIAPACGGLEGIGLISVLLVAYIVLRRRVLRFPHVLWLLPMGIVAMWAVNVLRIAALLVVGAFFDTELALGGFHSKAGWALFCVVALATIALARTFEVAASGEPADAGTGANPTAAYVIPQVSLLAVALTTGIFSNGRDALYAMRVLVATFALLSFRRLLRTELARPTLLGPAVGIAVGLGWILTESLDPTAILPTITDRPSTLWMVSRGLGASMVVPIVEELAFRGYLMRRLHGPDFTALGYQDVALKWIATAALIFGLLHSRWMAAIIAGAVYGLLARRSGRLVDAMVAHGATNAVISAWILVTDRWYLWQ